MAGEKTPEFVYFLEISLTNGVILDVAVTDWTWKKNADEKSFSWTSLPRYDRLRHVDVGTIVSIVERAVVPYAEAIEALNARKHEALR